MHRKIKIRKSTRVSPIKNDFFIICEVKIWYQPHKKYGTGWVDGWAEVNFEADLIRRVEPEPG